MYTLSRIRSASRSLTLAALAWPLPAAAQERAAVGADVQAIVAEARMRSDRNWSEVHTRRPEYTFKWRKSYREKDGKGRVKERSELAELFVPRCPPGACRPAWIVLERDGRPVAADKVERERRRAGERLEKEERRGRVESAEGGAGRPRTNWLQFTYFTKGMFVEDRSVKIDGPEILEKCELTYAGREEVRGREMIVLDFRPRRGVVFEGPSRFTSALEGRLWIDAADMLFARLAAWPKGAAPASASSDELLREAALAYDMVRTKEGVWFTALGRVNGLKYPGLFDGVDTDFSIESFDYARFAVDADVKLDAPSKTEH